MLLFVLSDFQIIVVCNMLTLTLILTLMLTLALTLMQHLHICRSEPKQNSLLFYWARLLFWHFQIKKKIYWQLFWE